MSSLSDEAVLMIGRYETQTYSIPVAGRIVRLLGPKDPHALHSDPEMVRRYDREGYKPYWAEPWTAGVMLAEFLIGHLEPRPEPILELGAGLAVVGISLSMAGHRVVVTDHDEEALEFARSGARLNGVDLFETRCLDWREPPAEEYAVIVAGGVLYDRRHHRPIARLLGRCLRPGGEAYLSDPNRPAADGFEQAVRDAGLSCATIATQGSAITLPGSTDERVLNGRIFRVARPRIPSCG